MKENNKGFTLVEIIVTFSLVATISFLLFQLILSLKNVYTTSDFKTVLLIDQGNITRRINTDFFAMKLERIEACPTEIKDKNSTSCLTFSLLNEATGYTETKILEVFPKKIVYDGFTVDYSSSTTTTLGLAKITAASTRNENMYYNAMFTIDVPVTNSLISGDFGLHIILQYNDLTTEIDDGVVTVKDIQITTTSIRDLATSIVIKGDGLYSLSSEAWWDKTNKYMSRYVFKGSNPKNYVIYNNKCYRMVSISNVFSDLDNAWMKLVYEGDTTDGKSCSSVSTSTGFSTTNSWGVNGTDGNSWLNTNAYLKTSLLPTWFSANADTIAVHKISGQYVGAVKTSGTLEDLINDEMKNAGSTSLPSARASFVDIESKIFVPTVSDFVLASNNESCNELTAAVTGDACSKNNYMNKDYDYWTVNPVNGTTNKVWTIGSDGSIKEALISTNTIKVRPVIFLNGNIKFTGTGTKTDPYIAR